MALLLFPFKAYVAIFLLLFLLPVIPPINRLYLMFEINRILFMVLNGYFLCIPVLMIGSIVQIYFNERKASLLTMLWAFTPIIIYFSIRGGAKIGEIGVNLWHRYCGLT